MIWLLVLHLGNGGEVAAQIDVKQYVEQDLFEIKPVIDLNELDEESGFQFERATSFYETEVNNALQDLDEGRYEEAIEKFEALSSEFTPYGLLNFHLGRCYALVDSLELAKKQFKTALRKDPLLIDSRSSLAMIHMVQEDYDSALLEMNLYTNKPENEAKGHYGLGLIHEQAGNDNKAKSAFRKSIKADPEFKFSYYPLAMLELRSARPTTALKLLNEALKLDPTSEQELVMRGMISAELDNSPHQLLADLERLVILYPDNFHYTSIKGFKEMELNNYSSALSYLARALNSAFSGVPIRSIFRTKIVLDFDYQFVVEHYLSHKNEVPINTQQLLDESLCLALAAHVQLTEQKLDSANLAAPGNLTIQLVRGILLSKIPGRERKAIEALSEVIELDATFIPAYRKRGAIYSGIRENTLAIRDFTVALKAYPKATDVLKARASLYSQTRNYAGAYRDLSAFISIDTNDYTVYRMRAEMLEKIGQFQMALNDYMHLTEFGVRLNGKLDLSDTYFRMGMIYLNQSDTAKCLQALDSAISYVGKSNYYDIKGSLLILQKNYDAAWHNYNDAILYYSNNRDFILLRAICNLELGYFKEAEGDLKLLVKKFPSDGEAHYYYGKALSEVGNTKDSDKYLRKAKELGYTPVN